jgi:hypothetical protein
MEKFISYDLLMVEIEKLETKFKKAQADHIALGEGYGEMMAYGQLAALDWLKINLISIPKTTITTDEKSEENEAS